MSEAANNVLALELDEEVYQRVLKALQTCVNRAQAAGNGYSPEQQFLWSLMQVPIIRMEVEKSCMHMMQTYPPPSNLRTYATSNTSTWKPDYRW